MPTPEMSTAMKVLAAVLDFFTIFMAGGFVIARLWGLSTDGGFKLKGTPALVLKRRCPAVRGHSGVNKAKVACIRRPH